MGAGSISADFAPSGRARTPDGLRALRARFSTPESVERAKVFRPRDDDALRRALASR